MHALERLGVGFVRFRGGVGAIMGMGRLEGLIAEGAMAHSSYLLCYTTIGLAASIRGYQGVSGCIASGGLQG